MKNLTEHLINHNEDNWVDLASTSKKASAGNLALLVGQLKVSYSTHGTILKNATNKPPASVYLPNKQMLIDFYEHPPKEYKDKLAEKRNKHDIEECPFCGQSIKPTTLDHFLPKDTWPEYAIFQNNLIPQCTSCAPIKGKDYYCDKDKIAKFISPFHSNLLSIIIFKIDLNFNNHTKILTPKVSIKIEKQPTEHDIKRIKKHFSSLDIKRRLVNYCNSEYRYICRKLKEVDFDILEFINAKVKFKPNKGKDWESSFYLAIMENQNLIEYFKSIKSKHHKNTNMEKKTSFDIEL